ncbi:uridine phosphorylase 1-like isoform X2 [Babylonia areolata]
MATNSDLSQEGMADGLNGPTVRLSNPNLTQEKEHFLYHLGLSTASTDFPKVFGDVKFVCVGGTPKRMAGVASHLARELSLPEDVTSVLTACGHKTERYSLFKVGPVLVASHGIGVPSLSVLLHELFKLLHLAGCSDVTFFRLGTCGGVGVEEGTVVISEGALNGELRPFYTWYSLGRAIARPVVVDQDLARDLHACAKEQDHFPTILGKTLCADDFYEGQARLDGALCTTSPAEKEEFLRQLWGLGVRNIEMESAGLLALCHAVGVKAAVACVCLVNRLEADCPQNNSQLLEEFQTRPVRLVTRYILTRLHSAV